MEDVLIHRKPSVIYQDGKPTAVILDIDQYEEILERLQDLDDLAYIEDLKQRGDLEFTPLDDFMKEISDKSV